MASAEGVIACVKAGLGIAVVSQWMCRTELESGELVPSCPITSSSPSTSTPSTRRPAPVPQGPGVLGLSRGEA